MTQVQKMIMSGVAIFLGAALFYGAWLLASDMMTYARYTDNKEGISIKYPRSWKVMPHPAEGAMVAFLAPKDNALDVFQENLNIGAVPVARGFTLEAYKDEAGKQMQRLFHGIEAKTELVTLSGHKAYKLMYSSNADDGLTLIFWAFFDHDVAYSINYGTTSAKFADPKRKKIADDMIRSLKVFF